MDVTRETILVVDDEEGMHDVIRAILEDEGYRVLQAAGGRAALAMLETHRPSLILSDVRLPLVTVGSKLSIQDSSAEGKGVRREAVILQTISQRASPSPRPGVDA